MISLFLAVALAASPAATPLAPKSSDFVLFVKSPESALPDLRGFLTEAGAWAPLLRPTELGRALTPLLGADLFDVSSLADAGLDVTAPMTMSFLREATVLCATSAKGPKPLMRARAQFAGAGQAAKQNVKGVLLEGAAAGSVWRAGVASKGNLVCFASGGTDALAALKGAAEAMSGAGFAATHAFRALSGPDASVMAYSQTATANAAFEVHAASRTVKLVGRAIPKHEDLLGKPRGADLLSAFAPSAPLWVRATLAPKAIADSNGPVAGAIAFLVGSACRQCGAAVSHDLFETLRTQLAGTVALVAKGLDPAAATGSMGRYFLVPHAYLLPVESPEATRKALESALAAMKSWGAKVTADGDAQWSISLAAREVRVGVARGALFVANDVGARDLALAALEGAKPERPAHALSFRIDGPLATSALRRVSVLDIPRSSELAALFAFGVETGALLKAAGPITGFAEPDGAALRFEAGFELQPSRP